MAPERSKTSLIVARDDIHSPLRISLRQAKHTHVSELPRNSAHRNSRTSHHRVGRRRAKTTVAIKDENDVRCSHEIRIRPLDLSVMSSTPSAEPVGTQPRLTLLIVAVLGFVSAIGPLSTDLYLPTFPNMAESLDISAAQVQLTVTGFLLGLGSGPLIVGPLSDRFGRKRILLIALTLFVGTGLLVTLLSNLWFIIALRAIQGASAAAGIVVSRAIVSDLAPKETAVRALSIIVFMVGLGAFFAAPVGAAVGVNFGWRGALFTLALTGALMLTLVALFVPESLPKHKRHTRDRSQPGTAQKRGAITALMTALRTKYVLGYALTLAASYGALMAWITSSPFISKNMLGLTTEQFAWIFATASIALLLASSVNVWLGVRVGARKMLAIGQIVAVKSAIVLLIMTLTNNLTVVGLFLFGAGVVAGFGLTIANTTTLALEIAGAVRGSASALMSTVQFMIGAIAVPFAAIAGPSTAVPMAITVTTCALIAASAATVTLVRSRPKNLRIVGAVFTRENPESHEHEALALRRASNKDAAGFWEFPGGKIEPGESPRQALAREITEELGIEATVGEHLHTSRVWVEARETNVTLRCFFVTPLAQMPTTSTDHDDMRWMPISELHTLNWISPDVPVVHALQARSVKQVARTRTPV